MSHQPTEQRSQVEPRAGEQLVCLVRDASAPGYLDREIGLRDLWQVFWTGKWVIAGVTILFAIASVFYALAQTEWYRAEVVLAPAEEKSAPALGGQLGGLAVLAGVSVGGGAATEAIAILKSRDFARDFIEELGLLPVLFAEEWDEHTEQWRNENAAEWPDIRDAVKYFHENVLHVREDRQTALVTLGVEWTDPGLVAKWADVLVRRLNARLRERALLEAETNIAYLQAELAQISVVTLQQTIGRLLETEMQKLMLARGNEEFAFRVIDSAEVPKERVRPKRTLIVLIGTMLGGMISLLAVIFIHAIRSRSRPTD